MLQRVLIVGHGSIGKRHLRIVRESLPEADIRVLRHLPCAETPEFANGHFNDLSEACAFSPEVAVIATPAPFHIDTASELASAGAHLLIEKPLSHEVEGVWRLLEQASGARLIIQVGYNLRFVPSLRRFRELLHEGAIGQILSVRAEVGQYLPTWRPDSDYRNGVSARRDMGGGVLLELSHELDYLRWVFGEVAWLSAWSGRQSALEVDVEDTAHLTLGFAGDAAGRGPVASLALDFIRHDVTRVCTAIGEKGSLRWQMRDGVVEEWRPGSDCWRVVFQYANQPDDSYRAQWLNFMECVRLRRSPAITGEDGLATLEVIEAAKRSVGANGLRIMVNGEQV